MWDASTIFLAGLGVLFIGLAKAGFGGALGMLTTPLCIVAFGAVGREPSFALGVILPLLCAGDIFSMYHYWGKWERKNLRFLLPGVVIGVCVGSLLVGKFTPRQLNFAIGLIAVLFVIFQVLREKIFAMEGTFEPNHKIGLVFGFGTGVTSTFAHGAGPVVSMFLIAQRLPKEFFVGTSVLIFTWVNWIKLPFFVANGIITVETAKVGLYFLPLIPLGVWTGVWANRRMSETFFLKLAHVLIFVSGIYLLLGIQPGKAAATPAGDRPATSLVVTNRLGAQWDRGAIIRGPMEDKRLALVFTAHEFSEGAETILSALGERRWKSSFFLTGEFVAGTTNRELVVRLLREGHYVGAHSDKHLLYCSWESPARTQVTRQQFSSDLRANLQRLRELAANAGIPWSAPYFLPPYEHFNAEIAQWTADEGLRLINYTPGTRSHADYTGERDKNFVASAAILRSIQDYEAKDARGLNGFILLLHLGAGPGREDKFHAHLAELLTWLEQRGYRSVRVDELL